MPAGRPSMMYYTPHLWGACDYLVTVAADDWDVCADDADFRSIPCDPDVYNVCLYLMTLYNYSYPNNAGEAVDLYLTLRHNIELLL